jgi:cytochrome b
MAKRKHTTRIWDLPTRTFHWGLAISFIVAYLTREDDHLAMVHIASGFTALGLVLFRILWGFFGSTHARFRSFIRGPKAIFAYFKSLFTKTPLHYDGHNPAGGLAILGLLGLGLVATLSGWMEYEDFELPFLEEIHEWSGELWLVMVLIHLLAVVSSSLRHRENLILAMITGQKKGATAPSVQNHALWALALLGMILCIWLWLYRHKWLSLILTTSG